jgi:hypothetical protein
MSGTCRWKYGICCFATGFNIDFFWLNTITIIKDICFMVLDGFGWFWMILGNGGSYHGK